MGCSRSDLCAARLLDKKDFMCVPFGSELANILTKVTKSERIIRRVLRNLGFRIKMNHRLIYSDPRFVLRILRDGVIDSVGVGTCFVTVLQEKRARICGLPADSLPSAKLRFKDEIERSDEEGDKYMLNISPPFTVSRIAKGLTRDALCANGVNRHNVGTVSESPSASSWMKCIQNIIDALDHFRKDHVIETEKTLVNGEVSDDYFCRRRGPHDMPRGCSTPIVQKTCVESEKEKEDYRARLFLPFSRSHAKPIPASEVEIPTPTSIWNESYKCQQLPSCRHPSVVGSGVKEFAEMAAMPRRLSNEKSLRGSIDWVKQSPTSPISISGFWPDMPRSHGRTVVNDAFRWSMEADGEDCRVSGKVAESPSTDINENDIELSELAHKRTCSMGGISVRKRSRVRSSGKIISESLLRYRGNNSDMFEYPGKLPQNLPEQLPGRWDFAAGNEDHSCGDINDVAPTNTASGISRIYTDEDHLFDPMRISVENLDTMRHDSGSLCSVLSCDVNDQHQSFVDVYEPVEFSSVAKVSCMHGNDIKSGTACNAYGVISLISWKTWGSHEGVPPLCVTKEFISPLSINQAREKQYTKDAKVSYENVVLSTYGSSSDDWCYHIGKNSIRRTHSSSDDKSYGRSE
uniref:Uncharacterized protein n=1 Tax=Ascaris lumbricoides TaxID=6252 RepID=A0A9J2PV67_ASCLU